MSINSNLGNRSVPRTAVYVAVLVLVLTLVSAPQMANATSVQDGAGSFNCSPDPLFPPHTLACPVKSQEVPYYPMSVHSSQSEFCTATTTPFGGLILDDLPCVRIFQAIGAGNVFATKNVFVTVSIKAPYDVPNAYFTIQGVFKGGGQGLSAKEVTQRVWLNDVTSTRTFAFEGVNRINIIMLCMEGDEGCQQDHRSLLGEGKSYSVSWQIEDPPSASEAPAAAAFSIPSELLVAFVAVAALPSAAALYLARTRRRRDDQA